MRKLYLFQVAYATDGKKGTSFSIFGQIGRTTAVLIKSTRLVKMKRKTRFQSMLKKRIVIKSIQTTKSMMKNCKFVILGVHFIEASIMIVGDTVAVRISEVSARR